MMIIRMVSVSVLFTIFMLKLLIVIIVIIKVLILIALVVLQTLLIILNCFSKRYLVREVRLLIEDSILLTLIVTRTIMGG